ncbi:hypothetical protein [Streptomyces sp. NBC_01304]|uniref:hypothetical protein n=1 Tax=Streptomyces sp. NBC_01304 TaxID=2903818 RepID=UPI002E1669DB|nr:hypothetical protein OG430_08450 [Streptomyces sp. NBC_01304]
MEKRIDEHAKNAAPLNTAATDPAFVPGFVPTAKPAPVDSDADVETAADDASAAADGAASASEEAAGLDEAAEGGTTADTDGEDTEAESTDGEGTDADGEEAAAAEAKAKDAEGPEFEATDRRGAITVDATGVHFRLDEEACEFTWDEISAVEQATSRFGRRFTVTVHTPNGRWYPAEVQAADKATLGTWADQLDKVLDAYFED